MHGGNKDFDKLWKAGKEKKVKNNELSNILNIKRVYTHSSNTFQR